MKIKTIIAGSMLVALFAAPVARGQFTWDGASSLDSSQTYDGTGIDSALDPHMFGNYDNSHIGLSATGILDVRSGTLTWNAGNPNVARTASGVGYVTVYDGATFAINNGGSWGSAIAHQDAHGEVQVLGTMSWDLHGSNEQRLTIGNHGGSALGILNVNGTVNIGSSGAVTENYPGINIGGRGGTGVLNLNTGTMTVSNALPFTVGGRYDVSLSALDETYGGDATGTVNINDGHLVLTGSDIFLVGTSTNGSDYVNFTSYGSGSLSITNWTASDYLALASGGDLRLDGIVQTNLDAFTFSATGSMGTLEANFVAPAAPAAPANLSTFVISTSITLSWDDEFGTTYKIYRSATSGSGYTEVASQGGSPFADTLTGSDYYYVIRAVRGGVESADSAQVVATQGTPPPAPTTRKIWINGTTAKLYWNPAATAANYVVKRSETSGANYLNVATTSGTEYWDTNLVAGTTYYYVIAGVSENGEGSPSEQLSGTTTSFAIISDGGGTWNNSIYTLPESLFDGDPSTFYDGNVAGAWAGADLGAGNERTLPGIDFYPRSGYAYRMDGAMFQGSNDGSSWDTLATISGEPATDWNRIYTGSTTPYRYFRCFGAQYGNIAELVFLSESDLPTSVPPAPTNLVATVMGQTVTVSWDPAADTTGYIVERDSGSGFGIYTNLATTRFEDAGLTQGGLYSYRVSATNMIGTGAVSDVISARAFKYLIIGSDNTWSGNQAVTKEHLFDGDVDTYADLVTTPEGSAEDWAGVDFGSMKTLAQFRFCLRNHGNSETIWAPYDQVQGANSSDFSDAVTLWTVPTNGLASYPAYNEIALSGSYQYVRVLGMMDGETNSFLNGYSEIMFLASDDFTAHGTALWWLDENSLPADDTLDTDLDGTANWKEYKNGTDPSDANSVLAFTSAEAISGGLVITWDSVAGKSYNVLTKDGLLAAGWGVEASVLATGANTSYTSTVSSVTQFLGIEAQ